jgi:aryl-alcohol dehydrogenase-like predicted oxidoreductase
MMKVVLPIPGTSTVAHLEENVAATRRRGASVARRSLVVSIDLSEIAFTS